MTTKGDRILEEMGLGYRPGESKPMPSEPLLCPILTAAVLTTTIPVDEPAQCMGKRCGMWWRCQNLERVP